MGLRYHVEKDVGKGNDVVDVLRWNLEVKPFDDQ
jgi:hypothetical protein